MIRIPLLAKSAYGPSANAREAEPISFAVALPLGLVCDQMQFAIVGDRTTRLVQTRILDRWRDQSARWLLVDTQLDVDAATSSLRLESVHETSHFFTSPAIKTSSDNGSIIVDTGAAVFRFGVGGSFPFSSVSVSASDALDATASGLRMVDEADNSTRVTIENAALTVNGSLRATVVVTGRSATRRVPLEVSSRIDLYAGSAVARLQLTLRNPAAARHAGGFWDLGDPQSIFLKDMSLTLSLPASPAIASAACSPERDAPWQPIAMPFELYQDSSGGERWQSRNHVNRAGRVPVRFRGYRMTAAGIETAGLRATPIVELRRGSLVLGLTMPRFWENFPKALEVDASSLTLRFFPKQYSDDHEIQPGEQKTHECFLSFAPDHVDKEPLAWCRTPTIVCAEPSWTLSTDAVTFLAALDRDHELLVNGAIDGADRFELKREVIDEYGWRHYGDLYGDHEGTQHHGDSPLVSHYNNQYDPVAGFACQFLRTADPRWRLLMRDLAMHVIDIDLYHTDRDKSAYNHGMFWHTYHYGDADTATHRSYPRSGRTRGGGPSADHNYTTGLLLEYFFSGEESVRQAVVESAQYVIDMDDGHKTVFRWLSHAHTGRATQSAPGYYGPGRAAANSLAVLINGHRICGQQRFLDKAEQLIQRVVHPNDRIEKWNLDNAEQRWFYTMFLQSLGGYLRWKEERGDSNFMFEYGRHSLLHYARWMAANEQPTLDHPEKVVFPTETWPAQDIRKSDVFALASVYAPTEQERELFVDRARLFFDYSIRTLGAMSTRIFTRPVVILLTSGHLLSCVNAHPRPIPPSPELDFGATTAFVPQRQIAERRARWLGVIGVVSVLVLILLLLFR
jgi:YetA-like protein